MKRLAADRLLSVHRLIQVVQMERMSRQEQCQWAERIVLAVHAVFPRDPENEVDTWPQCLRSLEQVQACDLLIQEHQLLLPEAADVLDRAGAYLRERALYIQAESLYQQAIRIRERKRLLIHRSAECCARPDQFDPGRPQTAPERRP